METIITRATTNTRMRDFYDIYILEQLHGNTLNAQILHDETPEEETVWLNCAQMAELFDRDVKTIGKHIANARHEELEGQVVVTKFATTTLIYQSFAVQEVYPTLEEKAA